MAFRASKELMEAYNKVFNEHGEVRPCGRQVCIDLINACEKFGPDCICFGNNETGQMNIESIKNYVLYGKG